MIGRLVPMRRQIALIAAFALVVSACAGGDSAATTSTVEVVVTTPAPDTTAAPEPTTTQVVTSTTVPSPTTTAVSDPALSQEGGVYTIIWTALTDSFWYPNAGSAADPFFFIHTLPETDGFYFSLEMYTTGYGALWTGELGEVDIICDEGPPAPNSTGICPHLDADGPGPMADLNADFAATGSITINKLDEEGYDIVVNEVVFSDGSSISGFQLTGP